MQILSCMALGVKHRESYPPEIRNFCITLKNISPAAYRFIREKFDNHLPHCMTITAWHANSDMNCEPGVMTHSLNILRRKVSEMAAKKEKLLGAVLFDEMSIRKHIQWVNDRMLGFEFIPGMDRSEAEVASEALVFMFSAINDNFRLPVAHYFVTKKIDAPTKMNLLNKVIEALLECGVDVKCIVFDGFKTNPAMCRILGANLDVYSDTFNPSFKFNGKVIRILFDFSHVEKLVRNILGTKKVLFDSDNNEIKWVYFERLLNFHDNRNFALSHKITPSHIQWESNPMKVKLAVETFSASNARTIEFLMEQGHPEFIGAAGTVRFIRVIDDLFDVCNSTDDTKTKPLKNPMSSKNAEQISQLFEIASEYIRGLQIIENGKKIKLCKT